MIISKRLITGFVALLLTVATASATSAQTFIDLVQPVTDSGFGGYYLRIEETMYALKVNRLEAHEIQNQLRDSLKKQTHSYSVVSQRAYLEASLRAAIQSVKSGKHESGFRQAHLNEGEFIIALDLDETLLSQWHRSSGVPVRSRDSALNRVPASAEGYTRANLLESSNQIVFRPGIETFAEVIASTPGFKGFVIFTAKEDEAARDVTQALIASKPQFMRQVRGVFTRNHLRFEAGLSKPSKDLRMIDPTLRHIFLIDDNESRVVQKVLNYQIPKFNADVLTMARHKAVKLLNTQLLPYTAHLLRTVITKADGTFAQKVSRHLGSLSQGEHIELKNYLTWMKATYPELAALDIGKIVNSTVFEPKFVPAQTHLLPEPFAQTANGHFITPLH